MREFDPFVADAVKLMFGLYILRSCLLTSRKEWSLYAVDARRSRVGSKGQGVFCEMMA